MNFSLKNQSKPFLLALVLTVSLLASINLQQANAQVSGTIAINNGAAYTNSTSVNLTLSAANATLMCFSNDNSTWSDWEAYGTEKNWTLPTGDDTYTVHVQYQSSDNQTAYNSTSIILDQTLPTANPFAEYYSTDYKTIYFDASLSTDNINIQNYTWNFGDGNITAGKSLLHTYNATGNYTVTLTVVDLANNTATNSFPIIIPEVSATPTPTPTTTPQPTATPTMTQQPTKTPTATPTTGMDTLTMAILIGATAIIVVLLLSIFMFKRKPKPQAIAPV